MVESVIPAVVKIMKDLRRPGEKVGIFYSPDENDKINGKIVEYEIPIISMVYPGVYLQETAYPVFAINKDLENSVVIAKWEKNRERVESKLFVVGIEEYVVARMWNLEIDRSMLVLYMEQSIAEHLGIKNKQRVIILPIPTYIWRAAKKTSDSDLSSEI
ncbi:MAG: hypothetical protein RXO35_01815 [Candidatus Micrarchaeota archaeon]